MGGNLPLSSSLSNLPSPDADPLLGRQVELVVGFDVPRLVPGIDIRKDHVYPSLRPCLKLLLSLINF